MALVGFFALIILSLLRLKYEKEILHLVFPHLQHGFAPQWLSKPSVRGEGIWSWSKEEGVFH